MDYPKHIYILNMEKSILYIKRFLIKLTTELCITLVNSEDPDKIPLYVAFHLGFHCLPKYRFTCTK